jgi:GNAT superfamily N-acetyltransferase
LTAEYRIATREDFDYLWDRNMAENPGEPMWPIWRERFRQRIDLGQAITFCVVVDGEPVGEGTLELNTGKDKRLCDGKTAAYLAALRIRKEFEGQGHISRLVRMMENHARELGFRRITIGVEEQEARNRAIYEHWGYVNLIMEVLEDGERVLYYAKAL